MTSVLFCHRCRSTSMRQKRPPVAPPSGRRFNNCHHPTSASASSMSSRQWKHKLAILLITYYASIDIIEARDNFFCGTTWDDASSNCAQREHCPNASDEECTTAGHICFADTMCSAARGDGEGFRYAHLANYLTVDYNDVGNTKFCGTWFVDAEEKCSLERHCSDDTDCDEENREYCVPNTPNCNILDLLEEEHGENWKNELEKQIAIMNGEEWDDDEVSEASIENASASASGGVPIEKLDKEDPRRNNYCGSTWLDANSKCQHWCFGEDTDCPSGLSCFAQTGCYYDDDLVPTSAPVIVTGSPTLAPIVTYPPTESPVEYHDPANTKFCGQSWADAIQNCSLDTHCQSNRDCNKGETCHSYVAGCNLVDMKQAKWDAENTKRPSSALTAIAAAKQEYQGNHFYEHNFCGSTYEFAQQNCSSDTHCGVTHTCPKNLVCHYVTSCSIFEIMDAESNGGDDNGQDSTTKQPQHVITDPNDPSNFQYCGLDWDDAVDNCSLETHCPSGGKDCPEGYTCFNYIDEYAGVEHCNAYEMTPAPTAKPTRAPVTRRPTPSPTTEPIIAPKGLCARKFADLQDTYRVAKECTEDSQCDVDDTCFFQLDFGSVAQMEYTTTLPPTPSPRHDGLCAKSYEHLQYTYRAAKACSVQGDCDQGHACFFNVDLASFVRITESPVSSSPTREPSQSPTTGSPTNVPSQEPTTRSPMTALPTPKMTESPIISTSRPSTSLPTTRQPTPLPTDHPTHKPTTLRLTASPTTVQIIQHVSSPQLDWEVETSPPSASHEAKHFYCALSVENLASTSCEEATACTSSIDCPPLLGCLEYDCNKHSLPTSSVENGGGWHFLPDRCPSGFVGLQSDGDCHEYFVCDNMFLGANHECEVGLRFAKNYGKCISEEMVDQNCYGIVNGKEQSKTVNSELEHQAIFSQPNDASEYGNSQDQVLTTPIGTYDPDLCPKGFVGLHYKEDCTKYYECVDSYLGPVYTCEDGLKFDRSLGICVPQKDVTEDCIGKALNEENQYQLDKYSGEDDTIPLQSIESLDEEPELTDYIYSPDLCPQEFIGLHPGGVDCQMYFECSYGYLVAVHSCESGFLFDKLLSECISETLVDSNCNGKTLEANIVETKPAGSMSKHEFTSQQNYISTDETEEQIDPPTHSPTKLSLSPTISIPTFDDGSKYEPMEQLQDNVLKPTLPPTILVRPNTPSNKGEEVVRSNTASPTVSRTGSDNSLWLWERDSLNGEKSTRNIKSSSWLMFFLPIIWDALHV